MFDFSEKSELIGNEIVKCIEMAKDGIHAFLLVFSVRSRFSREEEAVFQCLRKFFGEKITDYVIVVFTGGDDLEEDEETLEDYLGNRCPEPLQVCLLTYSTSLDFSVFGLPPLIILKNIISHHFAQQLILLTSITALFK